LNTALQRWTAMDSLSETVKLTREHCQLQYSHSAADPIRIENQNADEAIGPGVSKATCYFMTPSSMFQ